MIALRLVAGWGKWHAARRQAALFLFAAALLSSVNQPALAQDGSAVPASSEQRRSLLTAIEVEPGATCLAADKLVRRVERWLNDTKVDARISVHVLGDESEPYTVSFSIDRGDGHPPAVRRIDDAPADCDQLHSALALSIALAIDASIPGGGPGRLDLPDDETLVAPPKQPAVQTTESGYPRLAIAVLGQLSTGLLTSELGYGAEARLETSLLPWLDLRLGGLFAVVGDQRVAPVPGTFDASIFAGRADVCGALSPTDGLRLVACATGALGQFRTVGHDYSHSEAETSLWAAAGGGIEVQAEAQDRLAFLVSVDLLLPFARRTILVLDPAGQMVATRELTGAGIVIGVGALFRFF